MPGHHHSPCDDGVIQAQRIGAIPALSKPFPTKQARLALAATVLGSSMAFIDGPVVNIALPAIQSDFSGGVSTGASLADMRGSSMRIGWHSLRWCWSAGHWATVSDAARFSLWVLRFLRAHRLVRPGGQRAPTDRGGLCVGISAPAGGRPGKLSDTIYWSNWPLAQILPA